MPIYEYRCTECGHELEKLQKLSDPPLVECPACGMAAMTKLISAAGFRLKGGGWYETDFKKGNKKNVADSDGKSGPKAESKPDAKAEAKPKTDAKSKPESKSKSADAGGAGKRAS